MVKQSTIERNARIQKRYLQLKRTKGKVLSVQEIRAVIANEEYLSAETVRCIIFLGDKYSQYVPKPGAIARR